MIKSIISAILVFLVPCSAISDDMSVYFGHDYHFRKMEFSANRGKSMLKDLSRHKVLFGGIKFTESYGVEFGHGVTRFSPHNSTFNRGDTVNGSKICVRGHCTHNVYKTSGKITENYLDFIIRANPCSANEFRLIASAGVSFNKINITRKLTDFGMIPVNLRERKFVDYKANLRFSTGFEYMLHENIGFRNKFTWINTRGLRASVRDFEMPGGVSNKEYSYKAKGSVLFSIGLFSEF